MRIVEKLGVQVCFGSDRFNVGQGEWKMMTFDENHHCVFPLVPTACAYTKLDGYFGKLQKAQIEVLQMQGGCGENLAVRKVMESKNRRLMIKMGKYKAIISDMEDTIRNSLLRGANTIAGWPGNKIDFGNSKEIENCFI